MATSVSVGSSAKLPIKVSLAQDVTLDVAKDVLKVGVIGYGYWGPNIVRNFHGQEHSKVVAVCDKSPNSLRRVRQSSLTTGDTTHVRIPLVVYRSGSTAQAKETLMP